MENPPYRYENTGSYKPSATLKWCTFTPVIGGILVRVDTIKPDHLVGAFHLVVMVEVRFALNGVSIKFAGPMPHDVLVPVLKRHLLSAF